MHPFQRVYLYTSGLVVGVQSVLFSLALFFFNFIFYFILFFCLIHSEAWKVRRERSWGDFVAKSINNSQRRVLVWHRPGTEVSLLASAVPCRPPPSNIALFLTLHILPLLKKTRDGVSTHAALFTKLWRHVRNMAAPDAARVIKTVVTDICSIPFGWYIRF